LELHSLSIAKLIFFHFDSKNEIQKILCRYGDAHSSCHRGKSGPNTFAYKKPIKALIQLFLEHKMYGKGVLTGKQGSLAASLDRAIHQRHNDSPVISNIFVSDSIFSFLKRKNSQFSRPSDFIEIESKEDVTVGVYIQDSEVLLNKNLMSILETLNIPLTTNKRPIVSNTHWYDCLSEAPINFNDDWLPIVGSVIDNTNSVLKATVFDYQIKSWWETVPGKYYSSLNMKLLQNNKKIQRLFVYDHSNIDSVIEEALVQAEIGVEASVISYEEYDKLFGMDNMISVHDRDIAAVHSVKGSGNTFINTKNNNVKELSEIYDSIMSQSESPIVVANKMGMDNLIKSRVKSKVDYLDKNHSKVLRLKTPRK